jgi:hypothetical protein
MRNAAGILIAAQVTGFCLLTADPALAQPRMQPTLDDVTVPTPPLDVWLRRLVGRFELDGMVQMGPTCNAESDNCSAIKGRMDCIAIGNGPGVQCIINATWLIYSASNDLDSYLDPAMSMFGIDPRREEINLLLVNDQSLASGGFGVVKGHTASFKTVCRRWSEDGCRVGVIIEAKPEANINYMWIGSNIVISMRRVSEESPPPEKSK